MNTVQRIAKNMGMSGISQIIVSIFSFILMIYIARYFGEAEFGVYSFAFSFSALFVVFADIGISQFIVRDIARNKKLTSEYLTNASLIKILLSFLTFGLFALVIELMNYPSNVVFIVYLFGIYTILSSFAELCLSIFQAYEQMEYVAFLNTIEKIIIISLGLAVIFLEYSLTELAYVYILAGLFKVTLSFSLVFKKLSKPKQKINFTLCKKITVSSIPFGLNIIFGAFFFKIDTILLSFLQNDVAVGIYTAAYNPLLSFTYILTNIITSAIFPVMSRYFISSQELLGTFNKLSSKYMTIVGFPVLVGCFILADRFIELFYAGQFLDSIIVFRILAIFIPIRLLSTISGTLLTSINQQGIRTISVMIATVVNIVLNIILIPFLSYVGAGIATVLSEILLYTLFILFIYKYYSKIKFYQNFIKPIVASILMGIVLLIFNNINLLILIIIAACFYFTVLIIIKTFTQDDLDIFKQIIGR